MPLTTTEVTPIISNQRREHFALLSAIANMLIIGLEYVEPWEDGTQAIYVCPRELDAVVPMEELSLILGKNLNAAYVRFSEYDVNGCFVPHLEAEYPEIKAMGFKEFFEQEPLKLVHILKLLVRRKIYKRTCPIWFDW